MEAPTGHSRRRSHGRDGELRGLGMEARPHPHGRLLLGSPRGTVRERRMAGGYQEVYLCNGPAEEGVDGGERTDAPQIHALHG